VGAGRGAHRGERQRRDGPLLPGARLAQEGQVCRLCVCACVCVCLLEQYCVARTGCCVLLTPPPLRYPGGAAAAPAGHVRQKSDPTHDKESSSGEVPNPRRRSQSSRASTSTAPSDGQVCSLGPPVSLTPCLCVSLCDDIRCVFEGARSASPPNISSVQHNRSCL
jgi:hypothetical protein